MSHAQNSTPSSAVPLQTRNLQIQISRLIHPRP